MQKLKLKEMDATNESGGGRRTVSTTIAVGLLRLMRRHVGRKKAISKAALFQIVYGETYDAMNLEHFAKWDYIKRAMHLLRARSNCFVTGECTPRGWVYYVVSSVDEAARYANAVEHNIRGLKRLQKRATVAARQQWHLQEWQIEGLQKRFRS